MSLIEELGSYERAKSVVDNCPKNGMFYRDMDSVCDPLEILYYAWYGTSLLVFDGNNGWVKSIYHTGSEYIADQLRDIDKLKSELLEYRREHGIFEVGDLVVLKDFGDALNRSGLGRGDILKISEIDFMDSLFFNVIAHGFSKDRFRHATDLEIAAGHRL